VLNAAARPVVKKNKMREHHVNSATIFTDCSFVSEYTLTLSGHMAELTGQIKFAVLVMKASYTRPAIYYPSVAGHFMQHSRPAATVIALRCCA